MKFGIILYIVLFFSVGCERNSNNESTGVETLLFEGKVWTDQSDRIVVIVDGGAEGDGYVYYDHYRDQIWIWPLNFLETMVVVTDGLTCDSDSLTYTIVITDQAGEEFRYYSDNSACGQDEVAGYIEIEEIEGFLNTTLLR